MAIYRHVHVEFWKDPKVLEELTPEDKLFFIYLFINRYHLYLIKSIGFVRFCVFSISYRFSRILSNPQFL